MSSVSRARRCNDRLSLSPPFQLYHVQVVVAHAYWLGEKYVLMMLEIEFIIFLFALCFNFFAKVKKVELKSKCALSLHQPTFDIFHSSNRDTPISFDEALCGLARSRMIRHMKSESLPYDVIAFELCTLKEKRQEGKMCTRNVCSMSVSIVVGSILPLFSSLISNMQKRAAAAMFNKQQKIFVDEICTLMSSKDERLPFKCLRHNSI